jgi:CHASE3 domain sensor protein
MDEQINTDNADTLNAALRLIADIREAAGDPEGKLMQDELVAKIRRMRGALQHVLDEEMSNEKAVYEFGGYTLGEEIRTKITEALQ